VPTRIVTVYDKMQQGYRYRLTEPVGGNFDPAFRPELTPGELLQLGIFCGKYMTDTMDEFPRSWFAGAKLAAQGRDCSLNYFGVDASQPLSVWRARLDPSRRSARLVPMVLPLLHGASDGGGRPAANQALEGDAPPYPAGPAALRAGRPVLPQAAATGASALGIRQPENLNSNFYPICWRSASRSILLLRLRGIWGSSTNLPGRKSGTMFASQWV